MKRALVHSMIAPLYCAANVMAERDDEAWYGQIVEILEELPDGWYRIRTPYRYETLCHGEHLCFDEAEIARYGVSENLRTVYAPTADVMDRDTYKGTPIFLLTRGACVEVVSTDNVWTKIRLIGGREGFIRAGHLGVRHTEQNGDEAAFRKNVVETALGFLGVQYRWGGKTPIGIDCSGLCGTAYLLNGVAIWRNASIVEGFPVHAIERKDMQPGDLLFFKGHVAMYLGDGKYIHSTGRAGDDGVVINSLRPGDENYREDLDKGMLAVGSIF